jgi:hypothetical protein
MSLAQTFTMLSLLMLVAFSMAASTISQVGLTSRIAERGQADGLARAGVNEFILKAQAIQANQSVTEAPVSVLASLTSPVLVTPSAHLNGNVQLQLGRCTDNTQNPAPVTSSFGDEVPPYGLCLALQVTSGQHNYVYEAVLQQRWPYAVAGVAPILVVGATATPQSYQNVPYPFWAGPSGVQGGKVLSQSCTSLPITQGGPMPSPIDVTALTTYKRLIELATYGTVVQNGNPNLSYYSNALQLGGAVNLFWFLGVSQSNDNGSTSTINCQIYSPDTTGAEVDSNVDLWNNGVDTRLDGPLPTLLQVSVGAGNVYTGTTATNPGWIPGNLTMQKILLMPNITNWSPIAVDPTVQSLSLPTASSGSQVQINNSLTLASMTLQGAQLGINGDLTVSGHLQGSDSTLIVNGTLTLASTQLDAGGNGLVIWCKDLICCAYGSFSGLIVAQQGAWIFGSNTSYTSAANNPWPPGPPPPGGYPALPAPLTINGGLVVGENTLAVYNEQFQPQGLTESDAWEFSIRRLPTIPSICAVSTDADRSCCRSCSLGANPVHKAAVAFPGRALRWTRGSACLNARSAPVLAQSS